jgi:hypothetical protein
MPTKFGTVAFFAAGFALAGALLAGAADVFGLATPDGLGLVVGSQATTLKVAAQSRAAEMMRVRTDSPE